MTDLDIQNFRYEFLSIVSSNAKRSEKTTIEKLKGKTQDDWRSFSKILSVTQSRIKNAPNDTIKMKYQKQLDNLNFLTYKNGNNNTKSQS